MKRYRKLDGGGTLFSALDHQKKVTGKAVGILKLRELIDWESFRPVLEQATGYADKDWSRGGRPPFDPVLMFKILVLQKYHGLSDEATEAQINDRLSFLAFLDLRLGDEVPDANTIWDFKELIEKDGRDGARKLFDAFHEMLAGEGLIAREGSIVDASFVDAPRQRNSREENARIKNGERPEGFGKDTSKGRQKDCDARWTKKNNETHFGYKNHAKVDAKSKLIDKHTTTPANVHDSQVFGQLVDQSDQAVLADSAYYSEAAEKHVLEECDAEEFLMRKGYRNKPLGDEEKRRNKLVSRIRVRVEHVFGRMAQMGMDYCRRIGLKRAAQHNSLSNLVYNMDRYVYLKRSA
jgi:IS5 family transposase